MHLGLDEESGSHFLWKSQGAPQLSASATWHPHGEVVVVVVMVAVLVVAEVVAVVVEVTAENMEVAWYA